MTFTKMKQMGMRASFEPYELNDYLGVPRDQDPHEFFHEKFMQEENEGGRRLSSWFPSFTSVTETAVKSLHDMFRNAFLSRFAAPEETLCQPKTNGDACNSIDSCSWCTGKNVTDQCRPL